MTQLGAFVKWGLVLMGLLAFLPAFCQVSFNEEPSVRELLQRRLEANRTGEKPWEVWRVQIAATTDRRTMESTRAAFNRRHPHYKLHSTYSDPYYKLQVGAFYHKNRAEALLHVMKRDYPGAYLIRGQVRLNELTD